MCVYTYIYIYIYTYILFLIIYDWCGAAGRQVINGDAATCLPDNTDIHNDITNIIINDNNSNTITTNDNNDNNTSADAINQHGTT